MNSIAAKMGLATSPNPAVDGQTVSFPATIAAVAPRVGTPTSTGTFKDGSTTLSTGTLSCGGVTYTTASLASGIHSITASWGGDTNFNTRTSGTISQIVNKVSSSVKLASSLNPPVYG